MLEPRREFLKVLGAASTLGLAGSPASAVSAETIPAPPPDAPRDLKPTQSDLGSLFPDVQRIAGRANYELSFLDDRRTDFAAVKEAGRAKIRELIGYSRPFHPPQAQVLDRADCGAYVREKITFSTGPDQNVPAYVLIPKGLQEPAPAIIDLHSHGGMFLFGKEKVLDLGRNHPAMTEYHLRNYDGRPTATEWVKHGYIVITIDALMFGERRALMDADREHGWERSKYSLDDVKKLNAQCRAREASLVKALVLAGKTWPGAVFLDDRSTVDYLLTRHEVDPARIGCVGISLGGYRSMFLGALDERIRATCIVGFMSTVQPMIQAHVDTHSWVHFLPGLHRYLDWPDVAALHAPQPLFVQQCAQDRLFPPSGMRDSLTKIREIYTKAGAAEAFTGTFYDAPHQFTRAMQDDALAWFDRQLKGGRKG